MELTQVHILEPLTVEAAERLVRAAVPARYLVPRARLLLGVAGPWRPADQWPGALERLAWTIHFVIPEGRFFTDAGIEALGRTGLARRHAPVHPAELLAQTIGNALVLTFSDASRFAYAAVYRERHLRWSLLLEDRVRLVRCDGEVVIVEEKPKIVHEEDRTGVLLAGLRAWMREPVEIEGEDRMLLPESLAELIAGEPLVAVVEDGVWLAESSLARTARLA